MAQKPKIEYVGAYYSYGSEARKLKRNPVVLVSDMRTQKRTVYVDPVALAGIVLAVVLLVGLAVGSVSFYRQWHRNAELSTAVLTLKQENSNLRYRYESGFDREEIRIKARGLGMIPAEEAQTRFITVHMPEAKAEHTRWDDLVWFFSGLLERKA